ncbi:DoxX family protein [Martelella endophytica]|uniref:DoxX family protein n=1 Tax=Martelella endophytica TaxID=1486262 RepID=UPI0006983BCB|nr:DoxX family membrane protein [Martelella endophytica]
MITEIDKRFLLVMRFLMAWTFLYASSHQVFDPNFSVTGFLSHTTTFHWLFAPLTAPAIAPVMSFLVAYGHLAIGLSLLFGCLVRISAPIGAGILFFYWMAHMTFPFISDHNNLLIDYHIVTLLYIAIKGAGQWVGIDGWLARQETVRAHPGMLKVVG